MRTWTRTLTLAALAALVACTEDAPESLAGPSHKEADAAQPDLGQIYAATRAPAPPCYCRPMRVPPRFFVSRASLPSRGSWPRSLGRPPLGRLQGSVLWSRPGPTSTLFFWMSEYDPATIG